VEFEALDQACEALTAAEEQLGDYLLSGLRKKREKGRQRTEQKSKPNEAAAADRAGMAAFRAT
jgi:hypothetical protein